MSRRESSRPNDARQRARAREEAEDLVRLLNDGPSAYHAVAALKRRLTAAGFAELHEDEPFAIEPGGRYMVERHGSALAAFIPGARPPSAGGFRMIGAHTDSPALKLKPRPEIVTQGIVHLGIEIYGGPLLATWLDRDLGLCGRAILHADERTPARPRGRAKSAPPAVRPDANLEMRLFASGRPVVGMPNLAIHMNRAVNDEGLKVNPQTQLAPILGTAARLPEQDALRVVLGKLLNVPPARIVDFDAYLYDTQPACFAGWEEEFILGGHQDDLAMCHAAVRALIGFAGAEGGNPARGRAQRPAGRPARRTGGGDAAAATRVVVCYDSEEVGSQTTAGARSTLLPHVLERIALALGDDREGYFAALALSQLVSADNAHAVHPGFADRSEPHHAPRLNGGPVIKAHASRAYATDAYAAAFFELACRRAGVPFQRFVNRADAKSGSTIGSMTAAQLGVPTVDVGSPQFAMHSIREMGGALDPWYMTRAMEAFLRG